MITGDTTAAGPGPAGTDPLEVFHAAGVLSEADVRLARRLGRIGGDGDPEVLLAVALALRGPRYGHVCVELSRISDTVAVEPGPASAGARPPELPVDATTLPWPDPGIWAARLAASPLVRLEGPGETPLVLDRGRLYLDRYWTYEQRLATSLLERAAVPPDAGGVPVEQVGAWLDQLFGSADGLDRQRLAAAVALRQRLTVIAGGPGTGKTYTVARVLALLHLAARHDPRAPALRAAVAAPTGKAAARLQDSLRDALVDLDLDDEVRTAMQRTPSSTIHRLLGVQPGAATRFRHDARHPLAADVVIVDETSMVSVPLMAKLVDAVRPDARLILLGDRDQLASVEAGAAFGDLCGPDGSRPVLRFSPSVTSALGPLAGGPLEQALVPAPGPGIWDAIVRLDRNRRQEGAAGLAGVTAALQRLGPGQAGELVGQLRDATVAPGAQPGVRLLEPDRTGTVAAGLLEEVVDAYLPTVEQALAGGDPAEVLTSLDALRVLCARRRGPDGVDAWNRAIERRLADHLPAFRPEQRMPVGRPLLVTENDAALRLFNGDLGMLLADPADPRQVVAAFWGPDGGVRTLRPARLPASEPTFAMTIHKSQGSQFRHVVVVLGERPSVLLTRELVYTGLTRASERATLLASAPIVEAALDRPIQRASGLQRRLWTEADGTGSVRDAASAPPSAGGQLA